MIRHPLDEEFDMVDLDAMDADMVQVIIPDDPNLDTIIGFAMDAYKKQMDDVIHIEPKNRLKFYEVAEKFLDQAKDAMYKKEQIKLSREKLVAAAKKGSQPKGSSEQGDDDKTVSRNDLAAKVAQLKSVTK